MLFRSDFLIAKEIESIQKTVEQREVKDKPKAKGTKEKSRENKPKFTFKEQKEFETIDDDIAKLEEKIESLEKDMAANSSNYGKLNELMKEKDETQAILDEKYERWEYLNEIAEAIEEYKANN